METFNFGPPLFFVKFHKGSLVVFIKNNSLLTDSSEIRNPAVKSFYLKLEKEPENTAPLSDNLKHIVKSKAIRLYLERGHKAVPLKLLRPEKIKLGFTPAVTECSSEIYFEPVFTITVNNREGTFTPLKEDIALSPKSPLMGILDKTSALLFSWKRIDFLPELLAEHKTFEEVKSFADKMSSLPQKTRIAVDFTYNTIKKTYVSAVPIIQIVEYTSGITMQLLFREGEKLHSPDFSKSFLYLDSGNQETLEITLLKDKSHTSYFNEIQTLLKEQIIRSSTSAGGYNFTMAISLDELLIRYGETLLEKGYELQRKGTKITFKGYKGFELKFKRDMDWLDFSIKIRTEANRLKKIDFSSDLINKGIVKSGNDFFLISKKDIEKLKQLLLFHNDNDGSLRVSKYNAYFLDEYSSLIKQKLDKDFLEVKASINALKNFSGIESIDVSPNFRGTLRLYQKTGYNWLCFLYRYNLGGCLADDMGLGKTVQTLALLQKVRDDGRLERTVIAAPVSTLANWEHEVKRFTPALTVYKYAGLDRKGEFLLSHDIILVSYHTLRNDVETFRDLNISWLILDEAQAIKNSNTAIFKAVRSIPAAHKLTLTGTPVENSSLELWSQMDFLMPGLLGTRSDFIEKFAKPMESGKGEEKAEILRRIIKPFVLRRRKEDVEKSLPEKEEITLFVDMEKDQDEFYTSLREHYKKEIKQSGKTIISTSFFTALLRLRQAAILPSMIDEKYATLSSCKLALVKELLDDIFSGSHKVLLFSQFIKTIKELAAYFQSEKIPYSYIDGSTKNRKAEIDTFQKDAATKAFLISIKAGGTGINLTAADYVIILDPWWNPAVEMQAVDRAHRIGQTHKVIAYRIITKGTVEEKILKLQEHKKELVTKLISEEKSFLKSLTPDDINYIFSK